MTQTELMSYFFFNDTATTEIYTLSLHDALPILDHRLGVLVAAERLRRGLAGVGHRVADPRLPHVLHAGDEVAHLADAEPLDRKSTRLNSSHANISYAVFCLKKKIHTSHAGLISL